MLTKYTIRCILKIQRTGGTNMIGLTYIRNLNNMTMSTLAKKLETSKQNVNLWENSAGRKIPQKYIPQLETIFGMPQVYFQKEISEVDKLEIQKLHLEMQINLSVVDHDYFDQNANEWVTDQFPWPQSYLADEFQETNLRISALELLEDIKKDMFSLPNNIESTSDIIIRMEAAIDQYKVFHKLRNDSDISKDTLHQVMLSLSKIKKTQITDEEILSITETDTDEFDFQKELESLLMRRKLIEAYKFKQIEILYNECKKNLNDLY